MKLKVRFAIEPNYTSRAHREKCVSLYGFKFSNLVKEAKNKKYFASDYDSLKRIRKLLSQYGNVAELIPVIGDRVNEANVMKLVQVAPMFDVAAPDLKAYILMSLGLRTYDGEFQ
jgi:hypothetical protein